jgi:hypothetical protein
LEKKSQIWITTKKTPFFSFPDACAIVAMVTENLKNALESTIF